MRRGGRFARPRERGPDGVIVASDAVDDNFVKVIPSSSRLSVFFSFLLSIIVLQQVFNPLAPLSIVVATTTVIFISVKIGTDRITTEAATL